MQPKTVPVPRPHADTVVTREWAAVFWEREGR